MRRSSKLTHIRPPASESRTQATSSKSGSRTVACVTSHSPWTQTTVSELLSAIHLFTALTLLGADWVEIIAQNPVDQTENVNETDLSTYRMNHTMIRVKDKDASLKFYQDVMGMNLVRTAENESAKFNLYFLSYSAREGESTADKEGLLELTWNYGTEKQEGKVYHDGNSEPQGFGHICVSVDDINAACARFDERGVQWKKKLTDGRMRNIAFVLDPDG